MVTGWVWGKISPTGCFGRRVKLLETRQKLYGLYLITPPVYSAALEHKVSEALQGGAALLQYRDKHSSAEEKYHNAMRLKQLCLDHGALFIINDDIQLALQVQAHGVHLGQTDDSLQSARTALGEQAIIGISCYNRLELALQAQQHGADYVAFGRFFPSRTKPEAVRAEPALLTRAKQVLSVPIAAIGGINQYNAQTLIEAGADMLAVIEGVFGQNQVKEAAERLSAGFR